eukprot:g10217.t1
MLRSALISALSACLAVCTTLLFQHFLFNPPYTAVHNAPATPADTAARQQQDSSDFVAPSANAIDLAQALGLGRILLSRGEPEEAALVYRVAAATAVGAHTPDAGTNRDGGEAQHGLGLALLAVGRPEEALEACLEAERLDSSSAEATLCVGALLVEAGDTTGAVDAFRRALEKAMVAREGNDTVVAIRGRLGGALLDAGEVDEAISVMTDGNSSSSNGNIAYHLGVAWQTKGETDKAIVSYGRAVELEPNLAAPRINLGAQLVQSGRLPEAEAVLKSAVELAHDDPPSLAAAHANLGAMLKRSGRTQEALESYTEAVESGAGRSALMHIAMLHQDLGHVEQALEASRRAMLEDGDPLDTSPQLQVGLILESIGEIVEAVNYLAQVVELDDRNVDAMMHLAACQQRLGKHHEALATYLAASTLEPDNLVIYGLLHAAVREAEIASGKASEESEVQAAVDTSETRALPEKVAEPLEKTMPAGVEIDGQIASEASGGEILEERRPAWEEEPEQLFVAEGGDEPRGQDSQTDAAAAATAVAATAEQAAADRASVSLTGAEIGVVGSDSSSKRGDPDALGGSATKIVPGGGAGASVRQDSAEMRRLSESLSKDEEGATTTRGFFGKKVPESSKDPGSVVGISASTTPAKLNSNRGDGGAEAKDNGGVNTGREGPYAHGVVKEALVVVSDNDNIEGADAQRDEGVGSPSGIGTPLPRVNGMAESASVVDLSAAGGDASDEIETPSSSMSGGVDDSVADAKVKNGANGWLGAGGEEEKRRLNIPHLPMSDTSTSTEEQASVHLADDTAGDNDVGADSAVVAEGIDVGSRSRSGLLESDEVVSIAASEFVLGEGDAVPASPGKDSPVAQMDDATILSRDSAGPSSGATVDDTVVHKLEEGAAEQGEMRHEEVVEGAARDSSTAGVGIDSDILPAAAADAKNALGEDSDPISPTEAVTPDSEGSSFLEDGVDHLTTTANQGTAEEAKFGQEAAVEGSGAATSTDASVEDVTATPGQEGDDSGGEEGAVGGGTMEEGNDAAAENAPGTAEAPTAGAAGIETDQEATTGKSSSRGGDENASAMGGQATGLESEEAATTDKANTEAAAAAVDVPDIPVVVSEDDRKRARAKTKLGVAKLNQGQTKKAVAMFEKAASIDPGWWGGFYYAALAHDTLGNPEAAAGALISALGVPPVEEGEVAELAALSSKVLAALGGGNGPVAATLKTAMYASGLSFTVAPPAPKPPSPSSPDESRTHTSPQGGGGGAGRGFGRTPGMESSAEERRTSGGGVTSRTGLEADLADQFGAGAVPGRIDDAVAELGNTNNVQERRPFPIFRHGGDGGGGGVPGTNRGTVPGREQRREASSPPPGDWNGQEQDLGGARGAGADGSRFRDREGAGATREDRHPPSTPDAARRRSWSRGGLGGEGVGGDAGREPSGAVAGRGSDGRPPFKIDSTVSAEDIIASMGLKDGVGLGPAGGGGGARTPEDMMAAANRNGGDGGESWKKKGLFGGLWGRKDKGHKG